MSEQIHIDAAAFQRRVNKLLTAWMDGSGDFETLGEVESLLVVMGGQNDDLIYSKTTAIHSWLLGYEFPSTVILFTKKAVTFVTSASKAVHLEALKKGNNSFDVDILKRSKDEASNRAIWDDLISRIESQGGKVGALPKDKPVGKFADEWEKIFSAKDFKTVDVSPSLSAIWAARTTTKSRPSSSRQE